MTLKNKILYTNFNNTCDRYVNRERTMLCEEEEELCSSHEEADNRIVFFLDHISERSNGVIPTKDTCAA